MEANLNLVYGVVLAGALLHALWNALVKGGPDKLIGTVSMTASAALLAVCILPWLTQPAPASWPFIVCSLGLQLVYMILIARIYRVSDMSISYPLMRGTAPLLVALASLSLFHEPLARGSIAGIAIICGGILCMGFPGRRRRATSAAGGFGLALVNAFMIASYTLVDGHGVRLSGAPAAYTLWIFLLQGLCMLGIGYRCRGGVLLPYLRAHWRTGLVSGFGSVASYGTALWAMTLAPIAVVAALREISILFGVLLSVWVLKERLSPSRVAGACVLVLGAIILRLA